MKNKKKEKKRKKEREKIEYRPYHYLIMEFKKYQQFDFLSGFKFVNRIYEFAGLTSKI